MASLTGVLGWDDEVRNESNWNYRAWKTNVRVRSRYACNLFRTDYWTLLLCQHEPAKSNPKNQLSVFTQGEKLT